MEGKDDAAARLRVQSVGEPGLHAGALVQERQGTDVIGQVLRQARAVPPRLRLDSGQSVALRLGFDHAGRPAVHVEQVIGGSVAGP